jgi:hypothetical protein
MKKASRLRVTVCLLTCFLSLGFIGSSYADDAEVLPKGVWTVSVENKYYLPIKERFTHSGGVEDVATDYNADLNSAIFPELGAIEEGFMLPPGSGSLGNTVVSLKYKFNILDNIIAYGITDKLTIGVKIPYRWSRTDVNAKLDASTATLGKNPYFGTPGDPFGGAPFVPLTYGGIPLTTDDIQNLLGGGLIINGQLAVPGYGFKRFASWSDSSFEDIQAGLKYQYLKTAEWRLAFTAGVRFPTGKKDDPDNLVDFASGSGAWGLLFRSHNDYTGIKNLVFDATLRYDHIFPVSQTMRLTDIHHPLTRNEGVVENQLGDVVEVETSATYEFLKGTSLCLLYKYGHEFKSNVSGKSLALTAAEVSALEEQTDYDEHVFVATLSYTTLPLYMEKKFSFPITAFLSYRNRFAGTNNEFKSQYVSLGVQVYF